MGNLLKHETSPYLLQHKDNPVNWYPWCKDAFEKAKTEDKPIFLSIGYSTCHWCHVMAHESFEDSEIAEILNHYFISIKVDKEERPDIDSIYMSVCQALTGSGGWPTSIFMTADQKPFFAGTYFPKDRRGNMIGLRDLLLIIHDKWQNDRKSLLKQSDEIIRHLQKTEYASEEADIELLHSAVKFYSHTFDKKHAGFGRAPKFPTPHNIMFLLAYYEQYKDKECLQMAEQTLIQMYKGGIFDHIGFGFCRYSTDKKFLVPHFEKMLYDNALLILAYCKAYSVTKKDLYLDIAEKTAAYILREMTSSEGGFYCAQDADSEGEEGKFYLFTTKETIEVLGKKDGESFNAYFDITDTGNFEGRNIPNLLGSKPDITAFEKFLPILNDYRKKRYSLHLDDKILTSWNGLMIAAMCELYLVSKKEIYLDAAKNADAFIRKNLSADDTLFVSFRNDKHGVSGFLDDYASYIFAELYLYRATLEQNYLKQAVRLCNKVISDFVDNSGGFYLYSEDSEKLIFRPKETYDGAIPSGNSLMAYNLVRLSHIIADEKYTIAAENQINFLTAEASQYPCGYAMFLTALSEYLYPPMKVTVVSDGNTDISKLVFNFTSDTSVILLNSPTEEYQLKNNKSTYYVCKKNSCLPPVNDLSDL